MTQKSSRKLDDMETFEAENGLRVNVAYSDDDMIMIDNVEELADVKPQRVNMNLILFCMEGAAQMAFNGEHMRLEKNDLLVAPPNTTIDDVLISTDFKCRLICLTTKITNALLRPYTNVWNRAVYAGKIWHAHVEEANVRMQQNVYPAIREYFENDRDNPYHKEIMMSLLRAALLNLCRYMETTMHETVADNQPNAMNIFHRFLDMLNESGTSRQSVIYYSDRLCISPKYLSLVCKTVSGKTAKRWIEENTIESVRYYLRSTDYSIKEIADRLNFPNASYLGRYVKEHFGMTPMAYRKSTGEGS